MCKIHIYLRIQIAQITSFQDRKEQMYGTDMSLFYLIEDQYGVFIL